MKKKEKVSGVVVWEKGWGRGIQRKLIYIALWKRGRTGRALIKNLLWYLSLIETLVFIWDFPLWTYSFSGASLLLSHLILLKTSSVYFFFQDLFITKIFSPTVSLSSQHSTHFCNACAKISVAQQITAYTTTKSKSSSYSLPAYSHTWPPSSLYTFLCMTIVFRF